MKTSLAKWNKGMIDQGLRNIQEADIDALGHVMYEAYLGTIDYNGETLDEAKSEIRETFQGKYGKIIASACFLTEENLRITSAAVFSWYEKEQMPLLTFTMTRASHKGQGLATKLLKNGLVALAKEGYSNCCLAVTEGNEPAISIYKALGFELSNHV